jgi:small-conductance mechanosensitive channel
MTALLASTTANNAARALGAFLPKLAGAVVLLLVGLILARLIARVVARGLAAAGVDDLGERWGVHPVLERAGLPPTVSRLTRVVVRLSLTVVVVFAALSLLGLQFLSQSLNQALLFVPQLLVALVLLLAGVVLAGLARERADRVAYQMDFPVPLGRLAQIVVLAVFVLTAAVQISVATSVLLLIVAIALAAGASTLALAFGLGGRDVARALSAGRYVRGSFEIGQRIGVQGVEGEIVAIESAATILSTGNGLRVRLPHHLLLESIVTVHDVRAQPPSPDPQQP